MVTDEPLFKVVPSLNHSNLKGGSPSITAHVTEALLPEESVPENLNGFTSGFLASISLKDELLRKLFKKFHFFQTFL